MADPMTDPAAPRTEAGRALLYSEIYPPGADRFAEMRDAILAIELEAIEGTEAAYFMPEREASPAATLCPIHGSQSCDCPNGRGTYADSPAATAGAVEAQNQLLDRVVVALHESEHADVDYETCAICPDYRAAIAPLRERLTYLTASQPAHPKHDDWYCECGHPYDANEAYQPALDVEKPPDLYAAIQLVRVALGIATPGDVEREEAARLARLTSEQPR